MGLLTFSINVTLDGCVDHQEGIADDETPARALTQSSPIAPSSRAGALSGALSPRNTAYPLHEPRLDHDRLSVTTGDDERVASTANSW